MSDKNNMGIDYREGNPFFRILLFPFSLLFLIVGKLVRWLMGGLYDVFSSEKSDELYQDLLEGDYFHYDLEEIMQSVDIMNGYEFEAFSASLLRNNGFQKIEITKGSGDQGVDIIAEKEDIIYAFQCKNFTSKLGNTPVQEVAAGRIFYNCHVGIVLSNSFFTDSAQDLAKANMILLWDRNKLESLVTQAINNPN